MPSEEKDTNKSKYTWGTLILKTKLKKINSNLSRSVSSNLPTNDYYTNKEMISKATHGLKCNRTFDKSFDPELRTEGLSATLSANRTGREVLDLLFIFSQSNKASLCYFLLMCGFG